MILIMLIPILLLGSTWIDRSLNRAGSYPLDANRAWRILNKTVSYPNGTGWDDSERYNYHYNATYAAQTDSLTIDSYDPDSSQWTNVSYIHNTWLPGGEYLQTSVMGMRIMGMTFEMMKTLAVWDAQNRLTHMYLYSQPFPVRTWEPAQRIHVVYNGLQYTAYTWEASDGERPQQYGRINFTYDTQGRVLTETEQSSPDSLNWVNTTRTSYTWHPSDTTTGEQYISHIAHFMPQMLMMMDASFIPGMISELVSESWNGASWALSDKDVYSYNANNDLSEAMTLYYNGTGWQDDWKAEYNYDANQNLSFVDEYYWDNGLNNWTTDNRTSYNWEQTSAVSDDHVPPAGGMQVSVYPIPFQNDLSISVRSKSPAPVTIEIFNLKGQLIDKVVTPANQVYVWTKTGSAGVCFIKATQDGISSTRKVIRIK